MDPELKAYLDEKFGGVDNKFGEMDARLGGMDARFDQVDARLDGMDARLGGMDARLGGIDARFEKLEEEVRHNGVEIEHLRGQVQLISEAVSGLDYRLTSFQNQTTKDLADLRSLMITGFSTMNDRVRSLELWRESMEPRPPADH
jgi:archaellum component FlaC